MEVAELTARLVADVALFNQNMGSADATVAAAREQIAALERDLAGLKGALDSVGSGNLKSVAGDLRAVDQEVKNVRDSAVEAGIAARNINVDATAAARAEVLAKEYDGIRDTLIEIRAIQSSTGATDVAIAKTDLQVAQVTSLRDRWIEAAAAAKGAGPSDIEIAKQAVMAAEAERTRDALVEAAVAQRAGGGSGGIFGRRPGAGGLDDGSGGGLFAGVLPGGARARPAALLTLAGLGLSTGPVLAPAAVGAGAAAAAGLSSLVGAALTLKLAFADITSAAFTTQRAFDALTPVQQDFVSQLRTIDYGFIRPLEQLASQSTLSGLTAALKAAITPASTGVAREGVAAFGQGIGSGAQTLGSLFGSVQFAKEIGPVFQADASYVKDFFGGITNLVDAFVHLENAAIPLTDSLDKGVLAFTAWVDDSVKAAEASGQLAGYFNKAEIALHSLGGLVGSLGDVLGAFFGAVGFQNSLGVIQVFRNAFETIAQIINQNKTILRDFFAGAIGSAEDVIALVRGISSAIGPLLSVVNNVAHALGGWRVIIDSLIAYKLATVLYAWAAGFLAVGTSSTVAMGEVSGLRAALISLGAADVLAGLGAVASVIAGIAAGAVAATAAGAGIGIALASLLPTGPGQGTNIDVPASKIAAQRKAGAANLDVAISYDENGYYVTQQSATSGARRTRKISAQAAAKLLGISVAQLQGQTTQLPGIVGADQGAAPNAVTGAAISPELLALPQRIQNDLAAARSGHGNLQKANAEANRYYNTLLGTRGLTEAQKQAIYAVQAPYAGGGSPPPLLGTGKSGQLPVGLQDAIAKAQSDVAAGGSTAPLIAELQKGIAYINAHVGSITDKTLQTQAYQERAALYTQLASVQKGKGGTPSGLSLLPPGLATSLTAAQQAAAGAGVGATGLSGTGAFNPQDLAAQRELAAQQKAALAYLQSQSYTGKELLNAEKERVVIARELAHTQKQITAELHAQRSALASAKIDKILGLGPPGAATSQSLLTRERQTLLAEAKRDHIDTAGLVDAPLSTLIKTLARDGDIPKSTLDSLHKINAAITLARETHTKLSVEQSQNIAARLTQINDTLKQALFPSNYRAESADEIAKAIPGLTPAQRVAAEARIAQALAHQGTRPTAGAVAGIPIGGTIHTAGGARATVAPATHHPPDAVTGAGRVHAPSHKPPTAVSHSGGIHIDKIIMEFPNVTDGHQAAREAQTALLKISRRNPVQTRGPNAGHKLGL